MTQPLSTTEHGFVIVRPNGHVVGKHLYHERHEAEQTASVLAGCSVAGARRVTSPRKTSSTTFGFRTELIVEAGQ